MKRLVSLVIILGVISGAMAFASTIESTGTANVSLSPDSATLSLGIRTFEYDVTEGMAQVNNKVANIKSALTELGIADDDMVAEDVYIYSNFDYDTGANTGYNVSRQMQIVIKDVAIVGSVIDKALSEGADELNSITFTSSKKREAYDKAMAAAVADAKARAQVIADAQGIELKDLVSLKENENWSGNIYEYGAGDMGADASTELDVGSLTVSASVTAVYEAE